MSGLDVICDALLSRNIAVLSKNVAVSTQALDAFAHGNMKTLPLENIQAVVTEIWHGFIEYDATQDALKPVERPPARSMGVLPVLSMALPVYKRGLPPRGPQPEVPVPKKSKSKPGWLGGVW